MPQSAPETGKILPSRAAASTAAVKENAPSGAQPLLPVLQRILILISGMTAMAVYFTSILIASTVLPQMQGTFSATADEISWSVTFNILATAIAMPMTGWAVARFGRWQLMVYATALFTVSTLMCGLATSLEEMIFWRIVQGAAGAPSVPLVQTIVLDTFPPHQHRLVLGINGMGVVLGPIFGPLLGGMLAASINWRWAFFLLVPVGAAATVGLMISLPRDRPRGKQHFSWIGFLLLSMAVGGTQLMLARGQRLDWFESTEIQILLFVSCLAFYLFLGHSLTSAKPFLDLRLLLNRNYSLGLAVGTLFGMLNFTPMVLLPTLLRTHMGYPDELVGQVVSSRGLGGILGFFAVMFVEKLDPRASVALGFILQVVAGFWLMHISLNVSTLELVLNGSIQGFSSGIIVVALTLIAFEGIPRERMAEATAIFHLLRNIGASLFISVSVAEVLRSAGANYARLSELISPYNRALAMPWVSGPLDLDSMASLERMSREINRQAAMIGYINAMGIFTAVSAAAIPLILMMRGPGRKTA
jgi:MFS transporter, DHA2 family, multidrug resistance protein